MKNILSSNGLTTGKRENILEQFKETSLFALSKTYKNVTEDILFTEIGDSIKSKKIIAVDFHIDHITEGSKEIKGYDLNGREMTIGYQKNNILNIDHHADTEEMRRPICSTNLAISYVNSYGICNRKNHIVVFHHGDADSVLSSLILSGVLSLKDENGKDIIYGGITAEELFGSAAIAADHTGEENIIADVLQSIQKVKEKQGNFHQIAYSFKILIRLLGELKKIDKINFDSEEREAILKRIFSDAPGSLSLVQKRFEDRYKIKKLADNLNDGFKEIHQTGGIYYCTVNERIDGELLPAVFGTKAQIIIVSYPSKEQGKYITKVRLGMGAREGASLHRLGINKISPSFGGRWNAGSDSREGGTLLNAEEFAAKLYDEIS